MAPARRALTLIFLAATLAACAQFPQVDAAMSVDPGPTPPLLPYEALPLG